MWRTYGAPIHASPPVKEEARDPNEKMGEWFDSEALGWAASFGELDAVRELIICGANPLRPANKAGETPKSDAQRERHTHVVNFLTAYAKVCVFLSARTAPYFPLARCWLCLGFRV